jgi:hypothetical protein
MGMNIFLGISMNLDIIVKWSKPVGFRVTTSWQNVSGRGQLSKLLLAFYGKSENNGPNS